MDRYFIKLKRQKFSHWFMALFMFFRVAAKVFKKFIALP